MAIRDIINVGFGFDVYQLPVLGFLAASTDIATFPGETSARRVGPGMTTATRVGPGETSVRSVGPGRTKAGRSRSTWFAEKKARLIYEVTN